MKIRVMITCFDAVVNCQVSVGVFPLFDDNENSHTFDTPPSTIIHDYLYYFI